VIPASKFDPVHFYRRALLWHSRGTDEVTFRCSASRAYYGAFLSAREKLSPAEKSTPEFIKEPHKQVAECFLDRGDPTSLEVGNDLKDLRRLRNKADYDLSPPFHTAQSANALGLSLNILKNLGINP
jgi:hypothetical protein